MKPPTQTLARMLFFAAIMTAASLVFGVESALGAEKSRAPSRSKSIDFDGELVEGMNKKPLDSLSQISEDQRKRKKSHLYQIPKHFRTDTGELLRELRHQ